MDPLTSKERWAWRRHQRRKWRQVCSWRPFTGGRRLPPHKPGSRLEANQLEDGELLTGEDSRMPFRAPESRVWGPEPAPGWLPETTLGASFHCWAVLHPESTSLCQKSGFGQLKPHRAWVLWTCLSAFQLWASPSGKSDSPVTQAARAETAATSSLTLLCQELCVIQARTLYWGQWADSQKSENLPLPTGSLLSSLEKEARVSGVIRMKYCLSWALSFSSKLTLLTLAQPF